jgi:TM2 domain-containing membrane protein YozV
MSIYFKDTYGNRVGYINGDDIWNNNGGKVGYINGSEIRSTSGSRLGMLNGSDIKDTYGNRVGYINGSDIKDTYGNRVGYPEASASDIEMAAAALLLFDLEPATDSSSPRGYSGSGGGSGETDWAAIAGAILAAAFIGAFYLFKGIFKCIFLTKGGRIGLIAAGVLSGILAVIMFVTNDFEPAPFIGISASLIAVCGLIGSGIGAIVRTAKERKEEDTVKRWLTVFLLSFFLGLLGVDRFFVRKIGTGIIKLLTLGGLGVWWIIDWCMILSGTFTDKDDIEV